MVEMELNGSVVKNYYNDYEREAARETHDYRQRIE